MSADSIGPSESYWLAAATVLPVVALAIVLEARTTVAKWRSEKQRTPPTFIKAIVSISWFAYLAAAAISTPECFKALRGSHVPNWWTYVIEVSISGGLGVVALTPIIEILFTSEWMIRSFVALASPIRWTKSWLFRRELESVANKRRSIRSLHIKYTLLLTVKLAEIDRLLPSLDAEEKTKAMKARGEAMAALEAAKIGLSEPTGHDVDLQSMKERLGDFARYESRAKKIIESFHGELW